VVDNMAVQSELITAQVEQCQRLVHVIGLTQQMLRHADNGEWDQVASMEMERRDDMLACFADGPPPVDSELVAEAVAMLLHLNEELMAKLKEARQVVVQQGQQFARNRSAANSYKAVQASGRGHVA